MASATQTTVHKVVSTDTEGVTLVLNDDELGVLNTLLDRVGGNPHSTRRKHADSIATALRDANLRQWGSHGDDVSEEGGDGRWGAIYFK